MTIQIGNLESIPEDIVTGFVDLFEHPTGTIERIPVIIAEGSTIGPVLWITANIHGNEYAGIPVIHRLLNSLSLDSLRGTIVAIPSLNPAGSRIKERSPYYDSHDPNRLFPDGNPHKKSYPHTIDKNLLIQNEHLKTNQQVNTNQKLESNANKNEKSDKNDKKDPLLKYDQDARYPSIQELLWEKLFSYIEKTADYLIDLHNGYIKSIPFIFLDRVLYIEKENSENKEKAVELFNETKKMVESFGFTIIRETIPKRYLSKKLHRSTSGAALNKLHIPSFTVELGMYLEVNYTIVNAAVTGLLNVLKWAGMIDGKIDAITSIPVIKSKGDLRHIAHPRAPSTGIVDVKVNVGDFVKKGDIIAIISDIFGNPIPNCNIVTEVEGYIFMINEGILRYTNEPICWLATPDTQPMVAPWPKKTS